MLDCDQRIAERREKIKELERQISIITKEKRELCPHTDRVDMSYIHPHTGNTEYLYKCKVCDGIFYGREA